MIEEQQRRALFEAWTNYQDAPNSMGQEVLVMLEDALGAFFATPPKSEPDPLAERVKELEAELSDYHRLIERDLDETPHPTLWLRIGGTRHGFGLAEAPNIIARLRENTQKESTA